MGQTGHDKLQGETVATLGSEVLLEALGLPEESDRGFALGYLRDLAGQSGRSLVSECSAVVERTCQAVAYILTEAASLEARQAS